MATRGSNVRLPCKSTGYPIPTVTWSPAPATSPRFAVSAEGMEISDVQIQDEKFYQCDVSNIFGKTTTNVHLVVTGRSEWSEYLGVGWGRREKIVCVVEVRGERDNE